VSRAPPLRWTEKGKGALFPKRNPSFASRRGASAADTIFPPRFNGREEPTVLHPVREDSRRTRDAERTCVKLSTIVLISTTFFNYYSFHYFSASPTSPPDRVFVLENSTLCHKFS